MGFADQPSGRNRPAVRRQRDARAQVDICNSFSTPTQAMLLPSRPYCSTWPLMPEHVPPTFLFPSLQLGQRHGLWGYWVAEALWRSASDGNKYCAKCKVQQTKAAGRMRRQYAHTRRVQWGRRGALVVGRGWERWRGKQGRLVCMDRQEQMVSSRFRRSPWEHRRQLLVGSQR